MKFDGDIIVDGKHRVVDREPIDPLDDDGQERMWPLDVAIAAVSLAVLTLIFTQLKFDDPRPLFNAWTYAVLVPVLALGSALLMHNLVSQRVQKSIQLGFLVSVLVHLLLLMVAIRWVIFPAYFKDAFMGNKPRRTPIRKTVPEYVFESTAETTQTPDWSEPVDSETASRVVPEEIRRLPPVQRSAPKLQVPTPQPLRQVKAEPFLMRRSEPSPSMPKPSDSPSKLARRAQDRSQTLRQELSSPNAPELADAAPQPAEAEARVAALDRSQTPRRSPPRSTLAAPETPTADPEDFAAAIRSPRRDDASIPTIADSVQPRRRQSAPNRGAPTGAMPSSPAVAIAQERPDAARQRATDRLRELGTGRSRASTSLPANALEAVAQQVTLDEALAGMSLRRTERATRDVPQVSQTLRGERTVRASSRQPRQGISPVGGDIRVPELGGGKSAGDQTDPAMSADALARSAGALGETPSRRKRRQSSPLDPLGQADPTLQPLDVLAPMGPAGLSRVRTADAGVIPESSMPEVASMELRADPRPRREVGGPATPAGAEIAAVESFNRRVMRTEGGAAQTPAGMVGPETEEAIERGLAYLAEQQNGDGSWSLQGKGEDVLLQSDTAATGLCLLAFQGAGYTHKRHQYADVVAKGLEFLKRSQRTNGDLFKPEDRISNRNVALYSHGIAALATSEAYGMTQDPELRETAQSALDFIAATQHRRRGGWRYAPQISADTSVTGWMMMALKSGELSGLEVKPDTYRGIRRWLDFARQGPDREDRYRYDPFAPDTPAQRHGRLVTPTMTAVGMLMRMYLGWRRDRPEMKSAAEYLLAYPPEIGTAESPQRDTYYWYYATQVMFHMGGDYWKRWNEDLKPVLLADQIKRGPEAGSWDPDLPVKDRWAPHAGRLYVTTMNLLNLEVYYRHLPIYDDTAD